MKLFNASQLKEWDRFTCKEQGITSHDLMERAGSACAQYIEKFVNERPFIRQVMVFCGTGNNGGDGLVIARKLYHIHIPVKVYLIRTGSDPAPDFELNLQRLKSETPVSVSEITCEEDFPSIPPGSLVADCIFGTGLTRALQGWLIKLVDYINLHKKITIAIDVPSGLPADLPLNEEGTDCMAIRADYTLTFQQPKLSFIAPEYGVFTGQVIVADIGLSETYARQTENMYHYVTGQEAGSMVKPRAKFSHKGTYGHALIVAGSFGKTGAAVLAAKAAMKTGCGLLTVHVPGCSVNIMQTALPEAMVSTGEENKYIASLPVVDAYSAIGAGPGMGTHPQTQEALRQWLQHINKPIVLDADALNLLSQMMQAGDEISIPPQAIITPHPKEFGRLAGSCKNYATRLQKQQQFAIKHRCIVVLKGAYTTTALADGRVFINSTGNPLLATAGSGDVLTGIITSLLAQGYQPGDAAILGVYLHGACGDRVLQKGRATMLASEITEEIPSVFFSLGHC